MNSLWLIGIGVLQALLLLLLAPLYSGFARVIRAKMHSRTGPPLMQNYRDIAKLMTRQEVVSEQAGWIFRVTPYVSMGCMFLVAMIIPMLDDGLSARSGGGFDPDRLPVRPAALLLLSRGTRIRLDLWRHRCTTRIAGLGAGGADSVAGHLRDGAPCWDNKSGQDQHRGRDGCVPVLTGIFAWYGGVCVRYLRRDGKTSIRPG